VSIPALGRHSVHNALAAAAAAYAAGLDATTIARGLARPFRVPHRTTLLDLGPIRVLDDSYNAAPDSMIAALDLLATLPGRRVAILGEMLELGDASEAEHRRVGEYAGRTADLVLATGPMARAYTSAAVGAGGTGHDVDRREIEAYLAPGDVVLIKGSRGAAMDELLPSLHEIAERMKATVA
jgi:UDP-N-acetylmuramoyl-tripeptide--D-alanyl-D-alanine ligase